MKIRFLTAGESHGKCLTAIIEGVPAGLNIDIDFINNDGNALAFLIGEDENIRETIGNI